MTIRNATPTDLPALMPIFDEARRTIAALGIDQWQDGYPSREVIAADFAKSHGKPSLRIDTHKGNVVMRRMLEKNGFTHCGTIYLASGAARVAYEKIIK